MTTRLATALLGAALAAGAATAGAEGIYRCGDSYSQQPCPGGKLVDAADARSAGQKSQTDQAVRRDAKAADAMEKARLKEEARPAQLLMPPQKAQEATPKPVAASKTHKPGQFTAVAPKKPGDVPPGKKKREKTKKKDAAQV